MRLAMTITFLLTLFISSGCASSFADPGGKHRSFEFAQRGYTKLVRWGELERASAYVDPERREAFMEDARLMQGVRVTDFDIGPPTYSNGDDTVRISVVYHAYSEATLVEKKIQEDQEWYREGGMKNRWHVRPDLHQIVSGTTGSTR
jgi:hypothetical protein